MPPCFSLSLLLGNSLGLRCDSGFCKEPVLRWLGTNRGRGHWKWLSKREATYAPITRDGVTRATPFNLVKVACNALTLGMTRLHWTNTSLRTHIQSSHLGVPIRFVIWLRYIISSRSRRWITLTYCYLAQTSWTLLLQPVHCCVRRLFCVANLRVKQL